MLKINRRSILKASAASLAAATSVPKIASAQTPFVPPSYTPDDLKGVLTPFGAIKAGNADGSIPAWTGGGYPMPADFKPGDQRPVPFADDKPVVTITSGNMSQYQDKLSAGVQAMLQKYPSYSVQVFPTHRTAIAPQYVYDYIYKNATNAQLSADGNAISGAYGGIPFPIPKNGHEVMWNHELAWAGTTVDYISDAHSVTAGGEIVLESRVHSWVAFPYYYENGEAEFQGFYILAYILPLAPPYEAGGLILTHQTVDAYTQPMEAWTYLLGQRRVRRAPELQYDTPNSLSGGVQNWDEDQIFSGQLDRYDFNYTGIKEMYVPYNTNKAYDATIVSQLLPHFFNPDLVRWELHRCRVVELTLKSGARNVDARRVIYFDEDTGSAVLGDVYDNQGELWKVAHTMPAIYGDVPCVCAFQFNIEYDLHAGNYFVGNHYDSETKPQLRTLPRLPPSFFTPGQLAASAGGY